MFHSAWCTPWFPVRLNVSMGLNVSLNLTTFIHRTLCALWDYMCPRDCMCTRDNMCPWDCMYPWNWLPISMRPYLLYETAFVHGTGCVHETDCLCLFIQLLLTRWFQTIGPFETVWFHVISLGLANSTQPTEQYIRIHSCDIYYIRYGAHPIFLTTFDIFRKNIFCWKQLFWDL